MLFAFFMAKSSMYKRFNSAFGVQSTSLPVQKRIPIVRLCYGTGWVEVPCDYGAEENGWDHCAIMVRNEVRRGRRAITVGDGYGVHGCYYGAEQRRFWVVISWCGTGWGCVFFMAFFA